MEIDNDTIRSELEHILMSRCFRSRSILRKFLSYIVQETLAGRQGEITQYAIATKGLGKPEDFIPGESPLIRVQAGRLRDQLDEYYASEGRFNPIRIILPLGSYIPEFQRHNNKQFFPRLIEEKPANDQSQGPSIACIPRNFLADEATGWPFIIRLTHDYVMALSRFNYCQAIFIDTPHQFEHPKNMRLQYGADFTVLFDIHPDEQDCYSLKCSLVDNINRQIIWAHDFKLGNTFPAPEICQQIFKRIANDTVGAETGIAISHWARQQLSGNKPIASHHQVIVAQRQYHWDISLDKFHLCIQACEQRLEHFPDDIQALCVLADCCRNEYLLKYQAIKPLHTHVAQISVVI